MRPFILDWGCIQGWIVPEFYFGFLDAFHRIVFSYDGCQVSEACNFTATYGVEDSDVRAIILEE